MAHPLDPRNEPAKRSPEEMGARWQKMMQEVSDQPRDPDVLIRAGTLAEEMGRKAEAYIYLQKVSKLDPTKTFIVARMRRLASTPEQQKEVETLARRPASFGKALDDVFVYPLRGSGIGILILGAVFFYGLRLIITYQIFPLISWMVMSITAAYLSMFYVDVVNTTVTGSEDLPEWPDPVRFREFFMDWAKIGTAYVVAFLPVIVIVVVLFSYVLSRASGSEEFSDSEFRPIQHIPHQPRAAALEETELEDEPTSPAPAAQPPAPTRAAPTARPSSGPVALLFVFLVPAGIFILLGFVYLPMGVLANCIYGHPMACINPFFIIRSIGVARKNYAICILAYFGVAVAAGILEVLARLPGIFLFSSALATLMEIYGGVVQMRILGIFYRMNQARLGWMSD